MAHTYTQLINAVLEKISRRPPQLMAKLSQSFNRLDAFIVCAALAPVQIIKPLEDRDRPINFTIKQYVSYRHFDPRAKLNQHIRIFANRSQDRTNMNNL